MARPTPQPTGSSEQTPDIEPDLQEHDQTRPGSEPEPEPTPSNRRVSYMPGQPDTAPELISFIKCTTALDLKNLNTQTLLTAAAQGYATISEWEVDLAAALQQVDELKEELRAKQAILDYLGSRAPTEPHTTAKMSKSLPDPDKLSDGKNPTFTNWRTNMQGKFLVNADHFATEEAKMIYLFGQTTGDAQIELELRYGDDADEDMRFQDTKEMFEQLATRFVDPFRVKNARYDFKRLNMKATQTFTEFYTSFLQLASAAKIPTDDWRSELFDKLTVQLQDKLLLSYDELTTYQALANKCKSVYQGLARIQERTDRMQRNRQPLIQTQTRPPINPPRSASSVPTTTLLNPTPLAPRPDRPTFPVRVRPTYDNPARQALSRAGACFNCHQPGHMARNCPQQQQRQELKLISTVPARTSSDSDDDSGKEQL
jgi:hypothetical protein